MKKLTTKINITWSAYDVRQQAEDDGIELTDQEVSDILDMMLYDHDATIGLNWEVISHYIDRVKRNG